MKTLRFKTLRFRGTKGKRSMQRCDLGNCVAKTLRFCVSVWKATKSTTSPQKILGNSEHLSEQSLGRNTFRGVVVPSPSSISLFVIAWPYCLADRVFRFSSVYWPLYWSCDPGIELKSPSSREIPHPGSGPKTTKEKYRKNTKPVIFGPFLYFFAGFFLGGYFQGPTRGYFFRFFLVFPGLSGFPALYQDRGITKIGLFLPTTLVWLPVYYL